MLTQHLYIQMTPDGVVNRRSFLRSTAAGAAGVSLVSWMDLVRLDAADLRKRGLACILLFMQGGPSQFETFDPKPDTKTGGPTKAIDTTIPGVQVAEHWPQVAKQLEHMALIRSMSGREGNHQRAQYLMHTGYLPSSAVKYPSLGAIVAKELGDPAFDLPNFVSVGAGALNSSGFLGMSVAPFVVQDATKMPANSEFPKGVDGRRLKRRLGLMDKLERDFSDGGAKVLVDDHRAIYGTAAQMVLSPRLKAFDLAQEKDSLRDQYGRSAFGQGCLLARRLVETGVTFVEVLCNNSQAPINWDTHTDNFEGHQKLAGLADPGIATLVADLKERGLLDSTLVICMGEFGRTPTINGKTGRDHYPQAFTVALAGGGVKGGRIIGRTDQDGIEVTDRPVTMPDLFCTFCHALKINPRKENTSGVGRSIKIVEGGQTINELFA
jgi:hypothetical protein